MTPELYLSLMTLHGTLMVFFVLTLAPLNAFGNLVLPAQLGSRGMAFPRLNMTAFWLVFLSFTILDCIVRLRSGRSVIRLDGLSATERGRGHIGSGRRSRPDALVFQHRVVFAVISR